MPRRIHFALVIFCAGAALLAGCATAPPARKKSAEASAPVASPAEQSVDQTDYSPAAVERRTEAHARYAAAVIHDWDEEPELAAAEYLKAALADPENEPLVLE